MSNSHPSSQLVLCLRGSAKQLSTAIAQKGHLADLFEWRWDSHRRGCAKNGKKAPKHGGQAGNFSVWTHSPSRYASALAPFRASPSLSRL